MNWEKELCYGCGHRGSPEYTQPKKWRQGKGMMGAPPQDLDEVPLCANCYVGAAEKGPDKLVRNIRNRINPPPPPPKIQLTRSQALAQEIE